MKRWMLLRLGAGEETGNDRTLVLTGSVGIYGQQSTCMLRLNAGSEGGADFFFLVFDIICHILFHR